LSGGESHGAAPSSDTVLGGGYPEAQVGDIVYFDGTFWNPDLTQIYMFDQNHEPPVSLAGMLLHPHRPSLKKSATDGSRSAWDDHQRPHGSVHTGPDRYGVRAVIGKGGLYEGSLQAMKKCGAVYLAIVGGAAS
jgi:L(+)-tartrate dehydratase beta subunit